MRWRGLDLRCPVCKGELTDAGGAFTCAACPAEYPVILDIPDFRIFPDPFIDIEPDRAKARLIAERYASSTFEELVDFYYSITPEVPVADRDRFKAALMAGMARGDEALAAWERQAGDTGSAGTSDLLELGCGTGGLLVAAAPRYRRVAGIDLAFRWLVIGRKRLEEAGVDTPTICACAEALPFPAGSFDRVVADSAIEHFRDQPRALREAATALRPSGCIFITTPNRHSVGPDPHTGLWLGSWLPSSWTNAYMVRRKARPPVRTLLSMRMLAGMLTTAGFAGCRFSPPDIAEERRRRLPAMGRMIVGAYRAVKALPGASSLLLLFGPLLSVTARKRSA
ncbi:MAG: methyltransferase domain-containing protein [Gemmatimonadota bacterium]